MHLLKSPNFVATRARRQKQLPPTFHRSTHKHMLVRVPPADLPCRCAAVCRSGISVCEGERVLLLLEFNVQGYARAPVARNRQCFTKSSHPRTPRLVVLVGLKSDLSSRPRYPRDASNGGNKHCQTCRDARTWCFCISDTTSQRVPSTFPLCHSLHVYSQFVQASSVLIGR